MVSRTDSVDHRVEEGRRDLKPRKEHKILKGTSDSNTCRLLLWFKSSEFSFVTQQFKEATWIDQPSRAKQSGLLEDCPFPIWLLWWIFFFFSYLQTLCKDHAGWSQKKKSPTLLCGFDPHLRTQHSRLLNTKHFVLFMDPGTVYIKSTSASFLSSVCNSSLYSENPAWKNINLLLYTFSFIFCSCRKKPILPPWTGAFHP